MYIKRTLEKRLLNLSKKFPVVALTGPRQSGKTTLVKHIFKDYTFVSLEEIDNRVFAQNDPRGFLQTYKGKVIIDEVQKAPNLFSYLQTQVDKADKPGQYVLTGSQNFLLISKISQSLAGRTAILNLLPLSYKELKSADYAFNSAEEFILKGGYPRIYKFNLKPTEWYPSYIQTYIEKDIRDLKQITNLSTFQNFLMLCAGRIGQVLNLSDLARDCGISHNTARAWLSLLEASFIIFLLKPYFKNFNKRIIKSPKLYFYDTGIACTLLGIENQKQLLTHYLKGQLFENLIISEFIKEKLHKGSLAEYYFWRDKSGHEIDLLEVKGEKITPIEIKSSKTLENFTFKNLSYFKNLAKLKTKGIVVYPGSQSKTLSSKVKIISWQELIEFKI